MTQPDLEEVQPEMYDEYRLPELQETPVSIRLLPSREFDGWSRDRVAVFHGSEPVLGSMHMTQRKLVKVTEWALGYAEGFSKAMDEA